MKTYLQSIKIAQLALLIVSITILAVLPTAILVRGDLFTGVVVARLYALSYASLFFVMLIRPLADIFKGTSWLRPLAILRKGFGVLSASIIVSFLLSKIMADPTGYLSNIASPDYWSFAHYALFAHLSDIAAVLLLITSNNLSKKLLGKNWKRLQRLSYVYFYASAIYLIGALGESLVLFYLVTVAAVSFIAFLKNRHIMRLTTNPQTI